MPLSLVMTWVFKRTGQSLPLVMLLHAGINTTYSLVWSQVFPTLDPIRDTLYAQLIASTAVALLLIVATRGRLGLQITPLARADELEVPDDGRRYVPGGAGRLRDQVHQ